ncbi:MAG: hypothetical protein QOJ35_2120 [Solirubrobacteraceae bacterium]|jgi:hypothetical protein|nr:hypothetical protein [Solirubrobacteraceae bacterium]
MAVLEVAVRVVIVHVRGWLALSGRGATAPTIGAAA